MNSIIIISYNTRDMTLACLKSIVGQVDLERTAEIIVVDNQSGDGSADAIEEGFPKVKLLRSATNLGFAAANNLAAMHASGEFLLLLNPDTIVLDGAIECIVQFAKTHSGSAITGGRTLFADRSLNPTSCWNAPTLWSAFGQGSGLAALFRGNTFFNPEALPGWKRDSAREVEIVTGCFMLVRTDVWHQLGGFDTRYHMYAEDADLCIRAKKAGYHCWICPEATIVHFGGASERVKADKMVRLFRAKAQLFVTHWSPTKAWLGIRTLDLWSFTRMTAFLMLELLQRKRTEPFQTWRNIWRRRSEWHGTSMPVVPIDAQSKSGDIRSLVGREETNAF